MHRRLAAIILALLIMAGTIGYSPVTVFAADESTDITA